MGALYENAHKIGGNDISRNLKPLKAKIRFLSQKVCSVAHAHTNIDIKRYRHTQTDTDRHRHT